jgi:hypothetical protein
MTLNDAFEEHSIKSTQFVQRGSLLLLAVAASLMLAFRRHNGLTLGIVLALVALVVPAGYVLSRRMIEKARNRETETRLMMHTRTFLENQEPVRASAAGTRNVESDIEILARAIDGQKLPLQEFRRYGGMAWRQPIGDPVVFDAFPRRYAIRSLCDRRFADLAARLPEPATVPLS